MKASRKPLAKVEGRRRLRLSGLTIVWRGTPSLDDWVAYIVRAESKNFIVASGSAVSPSSGGARRAWTTRWSTSSGQSRRTSSWLIALERKVLSQLQTMSKKKVEEIAKVE